MLICLEGVTMTRVCRSRHCVLHPVELIDWIGIKFQNTRRGVAAMIQSSPNPKGAHHGYQGAIPPH
jgi:hypothetical protein